MTDLATQLRGSVDAQTIVQDMTDDANDLLKHINDLFNSPADKDVFLLALRGAARVTARLTELNRVVRYDFG
jgi:uncharacterized phage infection (PIP) family protein YhgE